MITVNAVGKACPEPVIMTKAALEKGATELEVLVDNAVAASNVTRLLEGQGFHVERRENGSEFRLTGRRDGAAAATAPASASCPRRIRLSSRWRMRRGFRARRSSSIPVLASARRQSRICMSCGV